MASGLISRCWYARLKSRAPSVAEVGMEYAKRLLEQAGCRYAVGEEFPGAGRCDHVRRRVLLGRDALGPGLLGVVVAAHEVGHAVLDAGFWARRSLAAAVVFAFGCLAVCVVGGVLGWPLLAIVGGAGLAWVIAEGVVREIRAILYACRVVRGDFPDEECRGWVAAETRAELVHVLLEGVGWFLVVIAVSFLLYGVGGGSYGGLG